MKRNLLNNWEVVEKLGEGSYAEVYKAYKKVDGIPIYCAVKHISLSKVKDTATIIESLKKEATIMQKLNGNKNIINYLNSYKETTDKGEVDCYIYMELDRGLKRGGTYYFREEDLDLYNYKYIDDLKVNTIKEPKPVIYKPRKIEL